MARLWQLLERPTLAQAEALSSWTMSSAVEMRVPFCSALISAGTPTTVTTARMPVSCAGHCDPACSADHFFWKLTVACSSVSRKPSFLLCQLQFTQPFPPLAWERACPDGVFMLRAAGLYPMNLLCDLTCCQVLWAQFNESSHFLLSQNRKLGVGNDF